MPVATATANTAFKTRVEPIDLLSNSEKRTILSGQTITVRRSCPARDKHVRIELVEPIVLDNGTLARAGFVYRNHWDGIAPTSVKLPVKWRSQRDNTAEPWRECNLTSTTMALDYLLSEFAEASFAAEAQKSGYLLDEPEDYYRAILNRYGDTTNHTAHTRALAYLDVESYFSYTLSIEDLYQLLALNLPVVLGVAYKHSGHMVVAVGYDRDFFYIHDPYGTRLGCRDLYDPVGGAFDAYSVDLMTRIWVDQGYPRNPECGWGRVVTRVRERNTGAPKNL